MKLSTLLKFTQSSIIVYVMLPFVVYASPSIISTSGSLSHGQSVVINGSGFGAKSTIAPLVWDDCSGTNITDKWSGYYPKTASNSSYNMHYSAAVNGVSMPHSHISKYMMGTHLDFNTATGGNNVMVWKSFGSITYPTTFYLSSYWRVDPQWNPIDGNVNDNNFKQFDFSGSSIPYNMPSNWYTAYNFTGSPLITHLDSPVWLYNDDGVFGTAGASIQSPDNNGHKQWWGAGANVLGNWVKTEYEIKITNQIDGYIKVWDNGVLVVNYSGPTDKYAGTARSLALGGYARARGSHNTRYFADIYFDTTPQRVIIGNASSLASSTHREIQIPQNIWNDGQTEIKVNQGSFADNSTAYLFVIDANGNASPGKPITFGTGSVGGIVAPTNLKVVAQ